LGVLIWISQDNGILLDRFFNITAVLLRGGIGRHSRPTLFALVLVREAITKCEPHGAHQTNEIKDALNQLLGPDVVPLVGYVQPSSKDCVEKDHHSRLGPLLPRQTALICGFPIGSLIWH